MPSIATPVSLNLKLYIFSKIIARSNFYVIYLVKNINTNREYALKVIRVSRISPIINPHSRYYCIYTNYGLVEKKVNDILNGETKYFLPSHGTFTENHRMFNMMNYLKHGNIGSQLSKNGLFSLDCVKHIAGELVLALGVMRSKGIIHRNLKPENIYFDDNWHIQIANFGSARILPTNQNDLNEEWLGEVLIGTPYYMSPEAINLGPCTFATDLWALGCIIYEMLTGQKLFEANGFDASAKDLIQKLLVINHELRLGALDEQPYESIQREEFFSGINWRNIGESPPEMNARTPIEAEAVFDRPPGFTDHLEAILMLGQIRLS